MSPQVAHDVELSTVGNRAVQNLKNDQPSPTYPMLTPASVR
jgi:hypothetical protein